MATRVIAAQDKTSSGAGDDVQIKAGNANTSGAGGNIILQPGIQATTGGNGAVQIKAQSNGIAKLRLTEPTFGYSMAITMDDYYYASISFEDGSIGLHIPSNMTIFKDGGIAARNGTFTGFGAQNASNNNNIGYLYMRSDGVVNWNGATGLTYGSVGTIRVSNASTGGGSLAYTSSTPTALSTNPTNDLVLTGSAFQRLSSSSALSVTGIAPPSTGSHVDGRLIWLYNVGSFNITLKHSQTSTAANQFINEGSGDIVLGPGRMVQAIYDSTSLKWRVNGETYPYVFPTADGTNGQVLTTNGSGTLSWATVSAGASASGTTNYIAKFTGASTLGNSLVYDDGSNVGIGTTSSLGRLDVVGANVYEPIRGITSSASNLESGSNNTLGLSVNNSNTTAGNGIAIGFNTATTNSTLYGVGAVGFNNLTHTTLGVPQGKFQVITRDSGGGLTPKLTIDTSGNVGIGNTAPGTKLEVTGTVRSAASSTAGVLEVGSDGGLTLTRDNSYDLTLAQSSSSSNGLYLSGAGNVYVCIDNNNNEADRKFIVSNNAVKATNELFSVNESGVVYASGNVGLGTSSPANQLHLHATEPRIQLTTIAGGATYSDGAWIGMDATGLYFIEREASSIRFLVNSSSEAARITSTGNVGIGTTSPGAKLQVDTGATGTKGQIIKAFLGQSANLSEWQDSTATVLSYVNSSGEAWFNGVRVGAGPAGTGNTVLGSTAGNSNTGNYNTFIGWEALYNKVAGANNVAVGADAGYFQADGSTALTTTSNSIYIGTLCRGFSNSDSNSIVIGYQAIGKGANTTVLGNTSTTASYIYGNTFYTGNGAGSQVNIRPLDRTTSGTGSTLVLWGADGVTSGNGGGVSLLGGYGPAGNGGDVFLKGGDSGGGTRDGTVISKVGGNGNYNCHEFRYGIAATYAFFDQLGRFCITPGTSTTAIPADATIYAATRSSATRGLIVKGAATQSANLTEWQDSTGTVVAAVSPTGAFTGSSFTPYGTFNSTTTIFGNNYWTPNYTGGVTSPSAGTYTKSTGNANTWDGQVYSSEGYTKNVYCAARASQTNGHIMFGLNSDPTTDGNYTSLDYAWYPAGDGILYIYENNVNVASYGTYTTSNVLSITYDGSNVQYWKDGVIQRTVARSTGNPLYFDTSFYTLSSSLNSVQFGPIGQPFGISGTAGYHPKFTSQQTLGNSVVYDNGTNVGIGTVTNLSDTVNIYQTAAPIIRFQTSGNQYGARIGFWTGIGMQIQCASANFPIVFQTAGTSNDAGNERMRITHDGLIGIGTASPNMALHVVGAKAGDVNEGQGQINVESTAAYNATNGTAFSTSGAGGSVVFRGKYTSGGAVTGFAGIAGSKENTTDGNYGGNLRFYTRSHGANDPPERMRIDSSGNVAVSAGARIGAGTGYINAGATAAGYLELYNSTSGATTLMNTGAFDLILGTSNTERLRVLSGGNVGIGTASPSSKFDVSTGTGANFRAAFAATNQVEVGNYSAASGYREIAVAGSQVYFQTNTAGSTGVSTRMLIDSSGNVGIGTSSPSYRLHISGPGANNYEHVYVAATTTVGAGLVLQASGSNKWAIVSTGSTAGQGNNKLLFYYNGATDVAAFDSSGNFGIGNVSPGARLQVDTGATGTKGQIIKAVASQTANLSEWQNNSGTALSYVASNGDIYSTTSFVHYSSGNSGYYLKRPSDNATVASLTWSSGSIETNLYALTFLNLDSSGAGIRMGSWTTWADSVNAQVMWLKNSNIIWGNNALGVTGRTAFNTSAFQITAGSYATIPAPTSRFEVYGDSQFLSQSTSAKTVIVKAAASQTANLTEWQNNGGTALAYMDANGNFAAVTKSFLIPHPTPAKAAEGKKLRYASLEGPENGVYFRGRLEGENVIILPDYWVDLVDPESITVNLTARKFAQPSLFVVDANAERVIIESDRQVCCDFIVYATRKDIAKLEVEPDGN